MITFLPLNLFYQFSKLTNLYFLIIMVLQCVPQVSNTNGKPTTGFSLFFVVLASAIKDFYEDYKRKQSDTRENNRSVQRSDNYTRGFIKDQWKNLHVGQIIKIHENQYFPCDLILIKSSNSENGVCYVETANLDGETNLKQKQAAQ